MKKTSGLAVFSFALAVFCWSTPFWAHMTSSSSAKFFYAVGPLGCAFAVLCGIIALIYIKKKGLRGRLLSIIGITMGAVGIVALHSL